MNDAKRFVQGFVYMLSEADFEKELSKLEDLLLGYFVLGLAAGTTIAGIFYVAISIVGG